MLKIEGHFGERVLVITPRVFEDERGFFFEAYRKSSFDQRFPEFVQISHSGSKRNVLRGLHLQYDPPMAKLMRVTRGKVFMVTVDTNKKSPTFGEWIGLEVSAENRKQVYAPADFARGFYVLSDFAEVQYLCTAEYNPTGEMTILWNDPVIGIDWPIIQPILSDKDKYGFRLSEWKNFYK